MSRPGVSDGHRHPGRQRLRVSEVDVDGRVLRCTVTGSLQPFLEALHGTEVVDLVCAPSPTEPSPRPTRAPTEASHLTPPGASARAAGVLFLRDRGQPHRPRLIAPILGGADYLTAAAANSDRVVAGASSRSPRVDLAAIALALYPSSHGMPPAWPSGPSASRSSPEGTFYLIGALGTLLVVSLAHQVGAVGADTARRDRCRVMGLGAARPARPVQPDRHYRVPCRRDSTTSPSWQLPGPTVALGVWPAPRLGFTCTAVPCSRGDRLFSPLQVAPNLPIFLNEIVLAIWFARRRVHQAGHRRAAGRSAVCGDRVEAGSGAR